MWFLVLWVGPYAHFKYAMSRSRGLGEVADVDSYQLALKTDVWHEVWIPCQYQNLYLERGQSKSSTSLLLPFPLSITLSSWPQSQQVLLDNNHKTIFRLHGLCAVVSCGLVIDTPVSSDDHIDKDAPRPSLTQAWKQIKYLIVVSREPLQVRLN